MSNEASVPSSKREQYISRWGARKKTKLADLLTSLISGIEPQALWCEPINGPKRLEPFQGLIVGDVSGAWQTQSRHPFQEARLFYSDGMLHLLTEGEQTRWSAWFQETNGTEPKWCPARSDDLADNGQETLPALEAIERKVLLPDQLDSRGLRLHVVSKWKIRVTEYRAFGRLYWWRLEPYA